MESIHLYSLENHVVRPQSPTAALSNFPTFQPAPTPSNANLLVPHLLLSPSHRAHQSNVFAAEFLPFNEDHMASGGNDADLKYYNLETEEGTVYSHHTRKVLRMTVHPDHQYSFMSCSSDGTVRMIDTRRPYEASSSGPIETVHGREGAIRPQALGGGVGIGMAPQAVQGVESSLVLRYAVARSPIQLYSVDFNPMNGNQFIVSTESGQVSLFDLRSIKNHSPCSYVNTWTNKIGSTDDITGSAFSQDGQRIVMTALGDAVYTFDANFNFEQEAQFPLCIRRRPYNRYEVCDSSEHSYTPEMLKRFYDWHPHPKQKPDESDNDDDDPDSGELDYPYDDEEEEDEEDLSSMVEDDEEEGEEDENGDDDENDENGDTFGDIALPSRRARWERRRRPNRANGAEDGQEDDDLDIPEVQDLLGMFPPNAENEAATAGIDLVAFLQLASSISSARRRRAAERRQVREAASESSSSAEISARDRDPNAMDTERPEGARRSRRQPRASPHGPNAQNDPEEVAPTGDASAATELDTTTTETSQRTKEAEGDGEENADAAKEVENLQVSESGEGDDDVKAKSEETGDEAKEKKKSEKSASGDEETKRAALNLPKLYLQRFTGHSSVQTIKGVGFWGPNSDFVVSGSDDANAFIWDVRDGTLLNVLEGHDDVVNCVVGHPRLPLVATSGIDDIVILWEPRGPAPTSEEVREKLDRIVAANTQQRRLGRQVQCGTQ